MSQPWQHFWQQYRSAHGVPRELLTFLLSLVLGIVVLPCMIWLVGRAALGPYANGGLFALWHDFLLGLARGSMSFWVIALGPYALLCLLRGGHWLLGLRT